MASVKLEKIVEKMKLENLTPELDISKIKIKQPDINRPALQMAGYFEHFEDTRLQIIGFVEYTYMEGLPQARQKEVFTRLLSYDIPAIIFSRELQPNPLFLEIALEHKIPLFSTKKATSSFMAEIIRWLNVMLAPCISVHGVLVDVFGEGVLITGESGIGKSEAALELIKRGHRLVTDDAVEIRKVSDDTLVGSAPDITKHFIELRGIGIIDVKTLFGVSSVKDTQNIDLVIRLETGTRRRNTTVSDWKKNIPNILAIRWCATIFRSVPDVTWQSSVSQPQSTIVRRRWVTMPHRNCTAAYRNPSQEDVMRTKTNKEWIFPMDTHIYKKIT